LSGVAGFRSCLIRSDSFLSPPERHGQLTSALMGFVAPPTLVTPQDRPSGRRDQCP